ncbi:histidine phosphatase family protein [Streptomyces bauhiniae]|uniref:Histidine phosphatase family protein n=1 Tax=Streptomyces bauhiniae TaxID=2340725 RepID=A0A4Z1D983_9ACTN|nr:histidine phosphatase family protein [Streptomyces bauhiniae]TGN79178.1 histidine phosphatase family protein [Streptomyces bauhiniae]
MTSRLVLISPAIGPALREARFYDGSSSIDDATAARAAGAAFPEAARVVLSSGARCRATAEALGLRGTVATDLAPLNTGRWRGRTLAEVAATEGEALTHWLTDPDYPAPDGESVQDLCARVGHWLESTPEGRTIAVVEPEVVRAAVVHALGLPTGTFWRLDVPPLTATELSGRARRWNLRLGRPLGGE